MPRVVAGGFLLRGLSVKAEAEAELKAGFGDGQGGDGVKQRGQVGIRWRRVGRRRRRPTRRHYRDP